MIIIIVFSLGSDMPSGLLYFRAHFTSFHTDSRYLSYSGLLYLFVTLLMLLCASVWENSRAGVPHFLWPY